MQDLTPMMTPMSKNLHRELLGILCRGCNLDVIGLHLCGMMNRFRTFGFYGIIVFIGFIGLIQNFSDAAYAASQNVIARALGYNFDFFDQNHVLRNMGFQVPDTGMFIVISRDENLLWVRDKKKIYNRFACSTGKGTWLQNEDKNRRWHFITPSGQFRVRRKIPHPIWIKPDWAFVEAGDSVPSLSSPLRRKRGVLGVYALDLGGGYKIHGTNRPDLIGQSVTHGCIRLTNSNILRLARLSKPGTRVYIY